MKKIYIVIFMFLVVIANEQCASFSLSDYFTGDYYVYTENTLTGDTIDLKSCYMTPHVKSKEAIGESMTVKNIEPISAIRSLSGEIKYVEHLDTGATVIYAHSNKINREVMVNGERVNLQIAVYDDYCVIGWPMILGGF